MGTGRFQLLFYRQTVSGGARRDRTADLYTASVALSQLSYSPEETRIVRLYFGSVKSNPAV